MVMVSNEESAPTTCASSSFSLCPGWEILLKVLNAAPKSFNLYWQ